MSIQLKGLTLQLKGKISLVLGVVMGRGYDVTKFSAPSDWQSYFICVNQFERKIKRVFICVDWINLKKEWMTAFEKKMNEWMNEWTRGFICVALLKLLKIETYFICEVEKKNEKKHYFSYALNYWTSLKIAEKKEHSYTKVHCSNIVFANSRWLSNHRQPRRA